jgi:hypothetical protein
MFIKQKKKKVYYPDIYPYQDPHAFAQNYQIQELLQLLEIWKFRALTGDPWRMRCVPTVYLAGVTKSGTTDFFLSLTSHSDVTRGWLKEQHYWSRGRLYNTSYAGKGMLN